MLRIALQFSLFHGLMGSLKYNLPSKEPRLLQRETLLRNSSKKEILQNILVVLISLLL